MTTIWTQARRTAALTALAVLAATASHGCKPASDCDTAPTAAVVTGHGHGSHGHGHTNRSGGSDTCN